MTGASGMIWSLVLNQCLHDDSIEHVIALNRCPLNITHEKYNEYIVADFSDLSKVAHLLSDIDIVFYCLGAYTGQLDRQAFYDVNVTYPKVLSDTLTSINQKDVRLCLLSGAGADRSGKSRLSFARDKGEIETYLASKHNEFYAFRPGYIYPVVPRKEPNVSYKISRWLYPLIKMMGNNASITSPQLATTMHHVGLNGTDLKILENRDIFHYFCHHVQSPLVNGA